MQGSTPCFFLRPNYCIKKDDALRPALARETFLELHIIEVRPGNLPACCPRVVSRPDPCPRRNIRANHHRYSIRYCRSSLAGAVLGVGHHYRWFRALPFFDTAVQGSHESDAPKIFHHAAKFDLFREVDRDNSIPPAPSNYYILTEPQVSGDGRIVVYTSTQECHDVQGNQCGAVYQTNIVGATLPANALFPGHGRISPDGRYVLACCISNEFAEQGSIFDLSAGQAVGLPSLIGDAIQAFADGGLLLGTGSNLTSLTLYRRSGSGWDSGTMVPLSCRQGLSGHGGSHRCYHSGR